jgi:hypothetical protein
LPGDREPHDTFFAYLCFPPRLGCWIWRHTATHTHTTVTHTTLAMGCHAMDRVTTWNVTPCSPVQFHRRFRGTYLIFSVEERKPVLVGQLIQDYTESYPSRWCANQLHCCHLSVKEAAYEHQTVTSRNEHETSLKVRHHKITRL